MTRKRIAVVYAGVEYSISGRALDEVFREIEDAVAAPEPAWLEVKGGLGRATTVHLLLGPGIPVAVGEVNLDGDPAPREQHPESSQASEATL